MESASPVYYLCSVKPKKQKNMETKKFKVTSNNGENGSRIKAGKNNTQTILTGAGIIGAAAVGAAAGYASGGSSDEEESEQEEVGNQSSTNEQTQTAEQTQTTQQDQQPQQQPVENQAADEMQPVVDENVDLSELQSEEPVNGETPEEVNPEEVAQEIAQANEIDSDDNEGADMLSVAGLTTAQGPDGQELMVAVVQTPDGGEYMLADIDGDGVFSDVFDMDGNYVGAAEGDLTASDLEEMADPSGGYLAMADDEPMGDDPTEDIVNTTGEEAEENENDLADNQVSDNHDGETVDGEIDDDEVSDDELLAQLLDDNDSDDQDADHVYDESDGSDDDADIAVDEDTDDSDEDLAENTDDDTDDDVDDSVDDDSTDDA